MPIKNKIETPPRQLSSNLWKMLSSDGETEYFIERKDSGRLVCECKGFEYRKSCRHVKFLIEHLGVEENSGPNPLFLAACSYQLMGYTVIPIQPADKRPMVKWTEYQTRKSSITELADWWTKTPNANVGLVLGSSQAKEGRYNFVLDLDGGAEAEQLLTTLKIFLPKETPVAQTANGYHVYLSHSASIPDRIAILKSETPRLDGSLTEKGNPRHAQIDVRGQGIIVAPPSIHPSGFKYNWKQALIPDLPTAPNDLLELIYGE